MKKHCYRLDYASTKHNAKSRQWIDSRFLAVAIVVGLCRVAWQHRCVSHAPFLSFSVTLDDANG